ncbi:MAG: primosomal protein N' [Deltaproteobacteria bacterium]|nr:primosomal protein N' [Deltaproteobacteria bacterium]MCB9786842.1 primosomal protein N' [Deltaproteobacteria bacterium]
MTARYVRVALPVPLHRTFTYRVPDGMSASAGVRVRVPFGPRRLVGVVTDDPDEALPEGVGAEKIRPLLEQLDPEPVLDAQLRALCAWMATYYHLPPGEAWLQPLPPGMTGGRSGEPRTLTMRTVTVAHLVRAATADERLGERMSRVLQHLEAEGQATAPDLRAETGASLDTLRRLEARGLLRLEQREVPRDPFADLRPISHPPPVPTAAQTLAIETISAALGGFSPFLLMGVTGSGKTEVYLRVIDAVLARGDGALVLVPEIALTPQLVARFRARLGDRIAALHSGLDPDARHEQWLRIASGELPVVIGARSALFAPLPSVGLIVVDEEHDPSFKQDTAPRYHARDLALVRGQLAGCPVLLGSATPSLESWLNTQRGRFTLLELAERALDRPMPTVSLVDLRAHEPVDEDRIFSQPLLDAVRENVGRGEQTILFLNRRGFAAFLLCRACGQSLSCPECSVTLTWHRGRGRLICHWCDHVAARPLVCPNASCGDDALQEVGFGTERVEGALRQLIPEARVARMDRDTTRGKALNRLLDRFRDRAIDVLVGTQMVAKGHDFPGVTLVGVLLAETGLALPDPRAAERTFHLLTQIAGRAGRADRPGRVLVQTYDPDHYALRHALTHDARAFLAAELELRQALDRPPVTHLAVFRLNGPDADAVMHAARGLAHELNADIAALPDPESAWLMGPQPAPIERIRGLFRWQLHVIARQRATLGGLLGRAMSRLDEARLPANLQVSLDVDPQSFL